jgi:hypothetical protein
MLTSGDVTSLIAAASIGDLDDVDITTTPPTDGDTLVWDTDHFEPMTPSGGAVEYIGEITFTALAVADIPLPAGYDSFEIEFHLAPVTDNVGFRAWLTDDNFATVETGAADYGWSQFRYTTSTGVDGDFSDAVLSLMISGQGNAANEYNVGRLGILFAKDATRHTFVQGDFTYVTTTGALGFVKFGGRYTVASVINGIRLGYTSGNLNGIAKVWGRKAA